MKPRNKLTPLSNLDPDSVTNQMDFDSLEDKIRGEEAMTTEENKKIKEERDIKKKLDANEVDKRLEDLKQKIKSVKRKT